MPDGVCDLCEGALPHDLGLCRAVIDAGGGVAGDS